MIAYYPWYIGRWRESRTRAKLNMEQRAIFREVLDLCFSDGGVPSDEETLRRLVGASEKEWQRSWPAVRNILTETENGELTHHIVQELLPEMLEYQEKRRNKSSVAATARWERERARVEQRAGLKQCSSNATGMLQACDEHATGMPELCHKSKNKKKNKSIGSDDPIISRYAELIFERHPKAARNMGEAGVAKALHALVASLPHEEWEERISGIDLRHQGWCAHWKLQHDKYAQGLSKYFAPTMGRVDVEPPVSLFDPAIQPSTSVPNPGLML